MESSLSILRRRLCAAILLLLMTSAGYITAETRSFNVEAGSASTTLREFAKQARVSVVMDRRDIQGVQTKEVSGLLIPIDALVRMLEGTPLVFKEDLDTGAFAVTRSEILSLDQTTTSETPIKQDTQMNSKNKKWLNTLAAVLTLGIATDLNAQNESENVFDLDPFKVEVSDGRSIHAVQSNSATRFATNISELPFAVNVLTEELLDDLSVTDVKDVLQFAGNIVGGESTNAFGTTTNARIRLRGFPSTVNLIDGFSVGANFRIAPGSIQRIEVVKGPASLLYGAVPPGGVVNFIRKRPTLEHQGSIKYVTGTWNFNRFDLDSSGPITENIRYRVNVSQEDRDFFSYGASRQALDILPQLEFDFADKKGNLLLEYNHSRVDQEAVNAAQPVTISTAVDPYGRQANEIDLNYPVKNFNVRDYQAPQWDETDSFLAQFRYWFNDTFTLRAAYRTQDSDNWRINQAIGGMPSFVDERPGQTAPQPGDANYGITGRPQWDLQGGWGGSDNLQVNLLMNFDFNWGNFQIMPGYDYNTQDSWFWRFRAGVIGENGRRSGNYFSDGKDIFDPSTWTYSAPEGAAYVVDDPRTEAYEGPGLLRNNTGNDGSSEDLYIYSAGNFLNEKLIVTVGYRESSFENSLTTTDEFRAPNRDEINVEEPLTGDDSIYQYGAVYKLIPEKLHVYGNFAQSFQPQLRTIQLPDADGNPIDDDLDGDGINDAPALNDNPRVPAQHLFGEGFEFGIKGSLGEGRMFNYSIAYFETTNNNIIRNITVSPNPDSYRQWYPNLDAATIAAIEALPITERIDEFQIQSGEEEAKGVEFELTFTPFEGWDIRTTYTDLETQLLADASSPQAVGRVLPNSPKDNFNLFTRYAFKGTLDGFFIGASADYLSERFSSPPQNGTAGLRARPRTLINAFAGYRLQAGDLRYNFQVNIQNLTDEFVSEGNNLGAIYTPRFTRLTVGVDF